MTTTNTAPTTTTEDEVTLDKGARYEPESFIDDLDDGVALRDLPRD